MPSALIWWRLYIFIAQEKYALVQIHMLQKYILFSTCLSIHDWQHQHKESLHTTTIFISLLPEKLEVHFVLWLLPIFQNDDYQFESTVIRQELHCKSNKTKTQLITSDCLYLNEVLPVYWQTLGLLHISKSLGIIIQLSFNLFCLVIYDYVLSLFFSVLFAHISTMLCNERKVNCVDWEDYCNPVTQ